MPKRHNSWLYLRTFLSLHPEATFADAMMKEVGKWLMDIAKYMTTAILVSSVFDTVRKTWFVYVVISIIIMLTFCLGIYVIKYSEKEEK